MNYITLEVEKNTDLGFITQLLEQFKFVKRVVRKSNSTVWDLSEKELLKETMAFSESSLSEEWDNPVEDEIWNDYLRAKLNEAIKTRRYSCGSFSIQ